MKFDFLDYLPSGYFPPLIEKLWKGDTEVQKLYPEAWPSTDFGQLIAKKGAQFPIKNREILVNVLLAQYKGYNHEVVLSNIHKLADANTFTITTGQQIHIFLGPMFVIYKALTTIETCKKLAMEFPGKQFVPVFWMATEDHDMAEIDHINFFGKTLNWQTAHKGPAGRADTEGLAAMCDELAGFFRNDPEALQRLELFIKAYSEYSTLAEATRYLLHHFFGDQGLVCIDADNPKLKKLLIPEITADILGSVFDEPIEQQTRAMKTAGLKPGVHSRRSNYFYLSEQKRLRIDRVNDAFATSGAEFHWTISEIEAEIAVHPEKFSPNVVMRPLYQEIILPNLAYVAGPGEMNYWFQLSRIFETAGIPRPGLLPRMSAVWLDENVLNNLQKLGLELNDMWEDIETLENRLLIHLRSDTGEEMQLEVLKKNLKQIYAKLYELKSPKLKEIKTLGEELTKKVYSEFKVAKEAVFLTEQGKNAKNRLLKLKEKYFSQADPQERSMYFVEKYLESGAVFQINQPEDRSIFSIISGD